MTSGLLRLEQRLGASDFRVQGTTWYIDPALKSCTYVLQIFCAGSTRRY